MPGINFRRAVRVMLLAAATPALTAGTTNGWAEAADPQDPGNAATMAEPAVEPAAAPVDEIVEAETVDEVVEAETVDEIVQAETVEEIVEAETVEEIAEAETIDQILEDEDPALTAVRDQIAAQEFDESIVWLNQQIAEVKIILKNIQRL